MNISFPLQILFGQGNYAAVEWRRFNVRDGRFEMSKLTTNSVNITDETDDSTKDDNAENIATLKRITCGQTVTAETKGVDSRNVDVTALVITSSNSLDFMRNMTKGRDKALLERARIIHFKRIVRGTEQDDKLITDSFKGELSGILNIALRHLGKVILNRYNVPQSERGEKLLKRLLMETTPPEEKFLKRYTAEGVQTLLNVKDIYNKFLDYADEQGYKRQYLIGRQRLMGVICSMFDIEPLTSEDGAEEYFKIKEKLKA